MSNPKPVEGTLRSIVEQMEHRVKSHLSRPHRGKRLELTNDWQYLYDSNCDRCLLEAALSAAPELTPEEGDSIYIKGYDAGWKHATEEEKAEAGAPARDGVRRLEAAMNMRMAVRQAFDVIAKANTVTVLSLAEMERVVIKELQAAAAKEQADGQPKE